MKSLKAKAGSVAMAVGAYAVLRVVGVIEAPESWSTYAPEGAGYSILTPGSMRESTETIPTMNGDIVFTDASIDFVGVRYQVGYARITGHVKRFSDVDLLGMMPMFFISDGLTAREQSFEPWNGHPAFFGAFEDKGTHIVNRNVLVGDRLYRIMATMPMRAAETERVYVEKFFEGFELQGPGGS